jgi:hypothetical protein
MAMTQRTVFEMRCDMPMCSSVVRGPSYQAVTDAAFGRGGWGLVQMQMGHGQTDVIHKCPVHTVENP